MAALTDRDLVRSHWPAELRPAFDALFDIDDAMADVVAKASQPALGAIKLAWWRERVEELDQGKVPAEPRLQAAAAELLRRGIKGAELAELERGWAELLSDQPNVEAAMERGAILFRLAARLLGAESEALDEAGRLFAAGGLKRRGFAIAERGASPRIAHRARRRLTGLAALAARDLRRGEPLEPEATPGRAWTLVRHRLTGRL